MIPRPPRSTRTDTLFPYTTLFRSLFCPTCGGTITYTSDGLPGVTAIPLGTFADPQFPPPHYSVYEERKHAWVAINGDAIERSEEHTSELQSLMRISYAVFCLKKKTGPSTRVNNRQHTSHLVTSRDSKNV